MSIEDKTEELVCQMMRFELRTEDGIDKARTAIRRALKGQDKETRTSCAEVMNSIDKGYGVVDTTLAYESCINNVAK